MEAEIAASIKSLKIGETTGLIYLQYTGNLEAVTSLTRKSWTEKSKTFLVPIRKMGLQNKQPP